MNSIIRIRDAGKEVTLEHVGGREGQTSIVHRLEDCVSITIGVSSDLDKVNALDQPINEVRECHVSQLFRERLIDVRVAGKNIGD